MAHIKKSHFLAQIAFGVIILGCLQTFFIGMVNGSLFVLSPKVDYIINFVFTIGAVMCSVFALSGILAYYRNQGIPPLIIQSGLFFSALVVLVTFFSAFSNNAGKRVAKKPEAHKFMRAEEFHKGSPNPELSKVPAAKDSLPKQ